MPCEKQAVRSLKTPGLARASRFPQSVPFEDVAFVVTDLSQIYSNLGVRYRLIDTADTMGTSSTFGSRFTPFTKHPS